MTLTLEGEEYSLSEKDHWDTLKLKRGMIVEVMLAEADASYPPDLWAGFLVQQVFVNMSSDGSLDILAKSLGCSDPTVTKQLSGLFNRKEGHLHCCVDIPCVHLEDCYALHVTKLRVFSIEAFHRDYLTPHMSKQIKKWLEGADEEEWPELDSDKVAGQEWTEVPIGPVGQGGEAAARRGTGAAPKAEPGASRPRASALKPASGRLAEGDRLRLRERLDLVKSRMLGDPSGHAGREAVRDTGVQEICSSPSSSGYSPSEQGDALTVGNELEGPIPRQKRAVLDVSGRNASRESSRRKGGGETMKQKEKKRKKDPKQALALVAAKAARLEDTNANTMTSLQNQLIVRAAGKSQSRAGELKKSKSSQKEAGGKLMKILTKVVKSQDKKEKKEKKRRKRKRKRKAQGLKEEPEGGPPDSSGDSPTSSYDGDSYSGEEGSSDSTKKEKFEPPLKRRSMQKPGSVLRMLVEHARSQLDQSSKISIDRSLTGDMTQGVRIASYFAIILRPQLGQVTNQVRELHHLANAIDLLRTGSLDSLGDLLASRFMALHQASLDGHWTAARHLEVLPMEETTAAGSSVVLEARKHARMTARVQNQEAFTWKGGGKAKGGRGKGNWTEEWQPEGKGKNQKGGKGKYKGRGSWRAPASEGEGKKEKAAER